MPRGKPTKAPGDLRDLAAKWLIAFANLDSSELWKALESRRDAMRFRVDWLLWTINGRRAVASSRAGLKEAEQLQRETRKVLEGIRRSDPRPLARVFNRAGPFRYAVWSEERPSKNRRGRPQKEWYVFRVPTGRRYARQLMTIYIVDTLPFANRLGRCDQCARFFLRERERPQRFCTERCSTEFHNKARLASGYFTRRRREQRARAATAL
jgi:hypothetical protein